MNEVKYPWAEKTMELVPYSSPDLQRRFEAVDRLIAERDNAVRERDACHRCWDDFTAKVCSVLPELKNAALFQQADSIVFAVTNRDMLSASLFDMQEERDRLKQRLEAVDRLIDECIKQPNGHKEFHPECKCTYCLAVGLRNEIEQNQQTHETKN